MKKAFSHPLRAFVLMTFVLFWILFSITGILVFSGAPEIFQTIMKNLCAWSSTFVLILFFRRLRPGESFKTFVKNQFPRTGAGDFLVSGIIQVLLAGLAVTAVLAVTHQSPGSLQWIPASRILPLVIINITSGPTGEELGWRGFALNEFQKRHNLLVSSVLIGLLWGLWHFPLWLVSGYAGLDLLVYSGSFMLGIVSFSVFLSFFYSRGKNLLVAVWLHFLFNVLMQIVILEDLRFMVFVCLLYLTTSGVIVAGNRNFFLELPDCRNRKIDGGTVRPRPGRGRDSMNKKALTEGAVSVIPVVAVHLVFLGLWTLAESAGNTGFRTNVTLAESAADLLAVPAWLLAVNGIFSRRTGDRGFLRKVPLLYCGSALGIGMHYFNWGITTGLLLTPDWETVLLFLVFLSVTAAELAAAGILIHLILHLKNGKPGRAPSV